jgi:ABC-type multidrug transport system permease subunit
MSEGAKKRTLAEHQFIQMVTARLREFWREPAAIFWVYVFPLVMLLALGTAFRNRPVETVVVALVDEAPDGDFAQRLDADVRFRELRFVDTDEGKRLLRAGNVDLVIDRNDDGGFVFHFDPTRSTAIIARNATNQLVQEAAGRTDPATVHAKEFKEPGGRYIDFLVPGMIGMGLLGGGLWGVGFAVVDLRIRKLLKRYLATPMNRSYFLASIMFSRLLFTIPEMVFLIVFSRLFYGVVCFGHYWELALLVVLGSIEFAGIGLLVASRAKTLETVSGLMNLVSLPLWMASGIFFSIERFPDAIQPMLRVLPLAPLLTAMRGVMLEGLTLGDQLPEIGIVLAWTVGSFALALFWFRWN